MHISDSLHKLRIPDTMYFKRGKQNPRVSKIKMAARKKKYFCDFGTWITNNTL
jgi:hypothetical protein